MTLFPLRALQQRAIDGLRESLRTGHRRPIIQAATGFGKTIIAAHIVHGALAKRKRVAFSVPALSLIDQTFDRFVANGIDPGDLGVMQADHPWNRPNAPIQICSIQTLARRGFPKVDFVVLDEAHIRFEAIDKWIDAEPSKIFVGLSATPWSVGLGDQFDDLIIPTSIDELTKDGFLAPLRAFAPTKPDLSGIKMVAGDYHEGELAERMSGASIVADVVMTWLEKADDRPTLLFAVNRAHADILQRQFVAAGVSAAYVDANTEREERTKIGRELESGRIKVICSVGTMTTGVDLDIRCISYARPTKSEILWVQSIGRGLRTAGGKADCILLDHSGTALTMGLPSEILHTELLRSKDEKAKAARKAVEPPVPIECPQCQQLIPVKMRECPGCGYVVKRLCKVVVNEGELIEIGGSKKSTAQKLSKRDFLAQLKGYAEEHSYKPGWPVAKFKSKTGEWPHHSIKDCPPQICSNKVRAWIRSEFIRWAKRRPERSTDEIIADSIAKVSRDA